MGGWRLAAWRWASKDGNTKRLIVVNFSDQQGWANVQLPDAESRNSDTISVTELLTGIVYERKASDLRSSGLVCGLNAWTAQIFDYGIGNVGQASIIVESL